MQPFIKTSRGPEAMILTLKCHKKQKTKKQKGCNATKKLGSVVQCYCNTLRKKILYLVKKQQQKSSSRDGAIDSNIISPLGVVLWVLRPHMHQNKASACRALKWCFVSIFFWQYIFFSHFIFCPVCLTLCDIF